MYESGNEKVVQLPVNGLSMAESPSRFNEPASLKKIQNIMQAMKDGKRLPPILVCKQGGTLQVLDGHHRLMAYQKMSLLTIPARVVIKVNKVS